MTRYHRIYPPRVIYVPAHRLGLRKRIRWLIVLGLLFDRAVLALFGAVVLVLVWMVAQ